MHIRNLIGDARSSSKKLENILIDELGTDRNDIQNLLLWWFSSAKRASAQQVKLKKKVAPWSQNEIYIPGGDSLVEIRPKGTGSPATRHSLLATRHVFSREGIPKIFQKKNYLKNLFFNSFLLNLQNLPVIFL